MWRSARGTGGCRRRRCGRSEVGRWGRGGGPGVASEDRRSVMVATSCGTNPCARAGRRRREGGGFGGGGVCGGRGPAGTGKGRVCAAELAVVPGADGGVGGGEHGAAGRSSVSAVTGCGAAGV